MLLPVRTGERSVARARVDQPALTASSDVWMLVAFVVVAGVVRFATISSQSYWVDEATTVHEVSLSLGGMLHAVSVGESSPPLYFILAWVWAKVFGTGEAGLRSLSVLLGTAMVPIAFYSGRELVSRRAGLIAAAFVAINPFMIWYSQEARAYMLLGALCGVSFLFFARSLRAPTSRNLIVWGVSSALALATHFFAGFLIAPEAIWLLAAVRRREAVIAAAALVVVQAALVPLAVSDASHPLQGWIKQFPLSIRIQQVPTDFGLGTLYLSSLVRYGIAAGVILAAMAVALVAVGGERRERRGALAAATMAGAVIFVPLLLALAGRDYYIARNLMPAWLPLAVLLGAACAAPRARVAGAALAAGLLAAFAYADIRIAGDYTFKRPDWRAVATALGQASGPRAIVAYDGSFAAQPLKVYLRGVPWNGPGDSPVTVGEVDVVGSPFQSLPRALPAGARLIGRRSFDDFQVVRFLVSPTWRGTPSAIGQRAPSLLGPAPPGAAVLIQP